MRSGKFGVVVLILAIVGTLAASWVMSMDVEEQEVTRYNPLADITGEFDREATPEYTLFNPSANYTGYYTSGSIIDGTKYFDGVDFDESAPNIYRVNLPPIVSGTETYTISDVIQSAKPSGYSNFFVTYAYGAGFNQQKTANPNYVMLEDLYRQLGVTLDELKISCIDSDPDWSTLNATWVTFGVSSWYERIALYDTLYIKNPNITQDIDYTGPGPRNGWHNPIMACKYDIQNNVVELFYDNDFTVSAGLFSPADVRLIWRDMGAMDDFYLGTQAVFTELDLQDPKYMDPSKGVELS